MKRGPIQLKWQAVAGGTVDNPQGTPLTAQQLIALYQDQGKPVQETYVWITRGGSLIVQMEL